VTRVQNSPPPGPTVVARLAAPEAQARRIASVLAEAYDPDTAACGAFEMPDGSWQVEAHFGEKPNVTALRGLVALAAGDDSGDKLAATMRIETIAAKDWVKASLDGLKPVHAGRFVVHGAHDRDRLPPSSIGIEIEAALAFGTGHHGTTRGCLLMLDRLARQRHPRHILDLGTGTGVLAIAAAKLWKGHVLASDIDRASVRVARENCVLNRVGPLVECVHAAGLSAPQIAMRAPFDLVFANILLSPLKRLAAPMARALSPNASVILSGLMTAHADAAIAAYRSQGLVLMQSLELDGWVTLLMDARAR
jgi:ribosomal protein L11 methyltransferase